MTSLSTDESCFDKFSLALDGVVVNLVDIILVGVDGVPTFLRDLDGVLVIAAETVVDFTTLSGVSVSRSVVSHICALSLISSTLLHLCGKPEVESDVNLSKLETRFLRVLVICRPDVWNDTFGRVLGAEVQACGSCPGLDKFMSFRGDNGTRGETSEATSVVFFVLFDGEDVSSLSPTFSLWFSSKII